MSLPYDFLGLSPEACMQLVVQVLRTYIGTDVNRHAQVLRLLLALPSIGPEPPPYVLSAIQSLIHYVAMDPVRFAAVIRLLLDSCSHAAHPPPL